MSNPGLEEGWRNPRWTWWKQCWVLNNIKVFTKHRRYLKNSVQAHGRAELGQMWHMQGTVRNSVTPKHRVQSGRKKFSESRVQCLRSPVFHAEGFGFNLARNGKPLLLVKLFSFSYYQQHKEAVCQNACVCVCMCTVTHTLPDIKPG